VTSCIPCNLKKGDKLPEEAIMHPRRRALRPTGFNLLVLNLGISMLPEHWKEYVYLRD
jgi:hypothetical protein